MPVLDRSDPRDLQQLIREAIPSRKTTDGRRQVRRITQDEDEAARDTRLNEDEENPIRID
jgi:hypothetical protein